MGNIFWILKFRTFYPGASLPFYHLLSTFDLFAACGLPRFELIEIHVNLLQPALEKASGR